MLGTSRLVPGNGGGRRRRHARRLPELVRNADFVSSVAGREEERFRANLRSGMALFETELAIGELIGGETAFRLHDTHGFPIELTREIAAGRGARVDDSGFVVAMERQRDQSREAGRGKATGPHRIADYREIVEQFGPTTFIGYSAMEGEARVLAVLDAPRQERGGDLPRPDPLLCRVRRAGRDTGIISTATGRAMVLDTTLALPGLHRHLAVVESGCLTRARMRAQVDAERRTAIRRNHTGTHLLHWALREVLGSHVKQHGSLMAPDRLRFDFTHYNQVTRAELDEVEDLVNGQVLADMDVVTEEMPRAEAEPRVRSPSSGKSTGSGSGWYTPVSAPRTVRRDPCRTTGDDRAARDRVRGLHRVQPAPGRGLDGHRHAGTVAVQRSPARARRRLLKTSPESWRRHRAPAHRVAGGPGRPQDRPPGRPGRRSGSLSGGRPAALWLAAATASAPTVCGSWRWPYVPSRESRPSCSAAAPKKARSRSWPRSRRATRWSARAGGRRPPDARRRRGRP